MRWHSAFSWMIGALVLCVGAAWAQETPQQFAGRIAKNSGVRADVNLRQTGSLGSIAIGLNPDLVADQAKVGPVMEEIGKFAVASSLKVHVVAPSDEVLTFLVARLASVGVSDPATRVMADFASIKTVRVFLSPPRKEGGN